MQVRREAVPQLAGVRGEIKSHLLKLVDHHPARALVAAKLAIGELLPLAHAADDGPHQQVGHVNGNRLRQAGELGRVGTDSACVAAGVQW